MYVQSSAPDAKSLGHILIAIEDLSTWVMWAAEGGVIQKYQRTL